MNCLPDVIYMFTDVTIAIAVITGTVTKIPAVLLSFSMNLEFLPYVKCSVGISLGHKLTETQELIILP